MWQTMGLSNKLATFLSKYLMFPPLFIYFKLSFMGLVDWGFFQYKGIQIFTLSYEDIMSFILFKFGFGTSVQCWMTKK
jgi:hypothetical protein